METFAKRDIIIINFPYSDLSITKRRPALVLACPSKEDSIICAITSQANDPYAIEIDSEDILSRKSFIRPTTLHTIANNMIIKTVGKLPDKKFRQVTESVRNIFSDK